MKLIGAMLLLLPFVGIAIVSSRTIGIPETAKIFAGAIATLVCVMLGISLLFSGL